MEWPFSATVQKDECCCSVWRMQLIRWRLPLATHFHTHYHLHPFHFVLLKLKIWLLSNIQQVYTSVLRTALISDLLSPPEGV